MNDDRDYIESASEAKPPSDTKILLAPLGRYALIGLAITATIVTTAIMLDDQLNDIDREVASLRAELQRADGPQRAARDEAGDAVETVEENTVNAEKVILAETAPVVNIAQPSAGAGNAASETLAATEEMADAADVKPMASPTVPARAAAPAVIMPFYYPEPPPVFIMNDRFREDRVAQTAEFIQERRAEHEQRVAENRAFMEEMDREYMQSVRAFQARSLESMREQLAREQQRLQEMEQRFLELHKKRAEDIQRRQEERHPMFSDSI